MGAARHRIHEKIQIAISVEIREHRPGGVQFGRSNAGLVGDLREPPVPEVSE